MIFEKTTATRKTAAGYLLLFLLCSAKTALCVECPPYEPSNYCLETKVTVGTGGQYPRYIQKSPGYVGGHTEGAGFGCVTGGVGICGWSGHDWSCSIAAGGLASGAVTYAANLQSETCEFPRTATSPTFSILVDATPPQTDISFPPDEGIIKAEDNIQGTATDDYQLGQVYTGGFPGYIYSFLGTRPASDDGGTLYYDTEELRTAFWRVPVSAVAPVSTNTLQEITFYLSDAVGNTTEVKHSIYIDYLAPEITIADPPMFGNSWINPQTPVIKGTASDDIGVDSVLLVIKDELSGRYWNGSDWQATLTPIPVQTESGRSVEWEYSGLTKENLRSSDYKIVAYARDLVGRQGQAQSTVGYKKRIDLGKMDFTAYTLNVKEVKNIARADAVDSFVAITGEDIVGVSADIVPYRMSAALSPYIKWNILGANGVSGNPFPTLAGNPSRFYTRIPPIPADSDGRGLPLAYSAFPRLEYTYNGVAVQYYSQTHKTITQDQIDQCRQEYVDMSKLKTPARNEYVSQETYVNPGNFPFSEINRSGQYNWAVFSIAQNLQGIRDELGQTMSVSSGYRNPRHNAGINPPGARNSPHIYGEAADIGVSSDADWSDLCHRAVNHGACVEPYSLTGTWVHMDWRSYAGCSTTWPHTGYAALCDEVSE